MAAFVLLWRKSVTVKQFALSKGGSDCSKNISQQNISLSLGPAGIGTLGRVQEREHPVNYAEFRCHLHIAAHAVRRLQTLRETYLL